MAIFPRPASPRALWRDLKAFIATRRRYELLFGILSIGITGSFVVGLFLHSRIEPPPPQLVYVESWPESRTDAEIIAQQKIDQKKRDEERERRRASYQRLADRLGIDTE